MKNKKQVNLTLFILVLLILVTGIFLPDGELKSYIAYVCIALILIVIHIFMPQLSGLEVKNPKVKTMRRLNFLMGVVIVVLYIVHNLFQQKAIINSDKYLLLFVVVIMMLVGNAAPKLPINGIIGIRLPWTMCDQDTWRVAHRILGYCTFPILIIMTIGGLLINPVFFSVGGLIAAVLIPSIYSLVYYLKKNK